MRESITPVLVPADPSSNITELLIDRVQATPDRALFSVPDGSTWRDISSAEFLAEVRAVAKGFLAAGVKPGDKVGFLAKTTYEWSVVDFALFFAGAVMVPVYETSSPAQVQWILSDSGATSVILEDNVHRERYEAIAGELPLIDRVWVLEDGLLEQLKSDGAGVSDDDLEQRRAIAKHDDVATIIYTAGSTGRPKGCVLTHGNFVDLCRNSASALADVVESPGASTVLFVTTAHVFARFISILCVHSGVRTGHQPDTKKLIDALGSFSPTFLLAVPRVFEKVYNSAEQKAESAGKGKIFRRAAQVAVDHSTALQEGKKPGLLLRLQFALFDKLVYGKLRDLMGGKVTYAVSGSAPLGARLGHFYKSLGIDILEGYGLTETTAPATVNRPTATKIGSVGITLPGVDVRIGDDSEVQIRGINVFREYWRNPEATAEAFDGEWFKTGDLGSLDDDGFLTITGRRKEILVTAGGKNVAPAVLEDPIRANPIISQVVVVGDQKPFIAALITLDPDMLPAWLATHDEAADLTLEQAAKSDTVRAEVERAIAAANTRVSRAESIREFTILGTEWTEATGHLTPKMSIKRHEIMRDFADDIAEIYRRPATKTSSVATP